MSIVARLETVMRFLTWKCQVHPDFGSYLLLQRIVYSWRIVDGIMDEVRE